MKNASFRLLLPLLFPFASPLNVPTSSQLKTNLASLSVENEFEKWARDSKITAPKLIHSFFDGPFDVFPIRGIEAKENIMSGENLVSLPSKATLRLSPEESTPSEEWIPNEKWKKLPWYAQLALKLLREKQSGDDSKLTGYVKFLPAKGSFLTPFHWSNEELSLLMYPTLEKSVRMQRKAWADMHSDISKYVAHDQEKSISREEFVWACECVISRAFSGNFGSNAILIVFSIFLASFGSFAYYFYFQTTGLIVAAIVSLLSIFYELGAFDFVRDKKKENDRVLLPFIDSINHSSRVDTDLTFNPFSQRFSVKSKSRSDDLFNGNEQVFISYGERGNTELLQFYG